MSLLDNAFGDMLTPQMVDCVHMDRTTETTPLGPAERYSEGAAFKAYLRKDNSPEIRVAERQGMDEFYTVIVPSAVALRRDDVFRRVSDGATFRCTSSTTDGKAPDMASLQIAKCSAKRWDIP